MLIAEPFAGASHSGLYLVKDEECSGLSAESLSLDEIVIVDDLAGFSLDGFEDEGSGLFVGQSGFEGDEVIEGDALGSREECSEAFAEELRAVKGE